MSGSQNTKPGGASGAPAIPKAGQVGEELLYEVRGPVGLITFNRPQARNALTFGMYDKLSQICAGIKMGGPIRALVLTAGVDLPLRAIREQAAAAFDLVVQVSRLVDGTRRITHVTEVLRMESDVITMQDIFLAKPISDNDEVVTTGNRLLGPLLCSGIKPQFLNKLQGNGVTLPGSFFALETERPGAGNTFRRNAS